MLRRKLGQFFCWLGMHDWYKGIMTIYCGREGCNCFLPINGTDFDGVISDEDK